MENITIKIKDQTFELKYTIESWKRLKESCGITPLNIQEKINEDFAAAVSNLIFYGMKPSDRLKVKVEELDLEFGFEVLDIILASVNNSMPKSANVKNESDDGTKK